MYYNQSCMRQHSAMTQEAAKGQSYGNRNLLIRSMQRAAVNIHKTGQSYEMLVFAPGRIKEHFSIDVKGNELTVSYTPPEGFPRPEWILREYSRGGFKRSFTLDESINRDTITAQYTDGVLQVTLPLLEEQQTARKEIVIS
jgi:HSP20 family protein